jgi:hypothetical protein
LVTEPPFPPEAAIVTLVAPAGTVHEMGAPTALPAVTTDPELVVVVVDAVVYAMVVGGTAADADPPVAMAAASASPPTPAMPASLRARE